MEINLTPEQAAFVRKGVEAGRFVDEQTAVLEGLSLLQEQEEKLAWLRAEIQIGIDELERGEGVVIEDGQLREFFETIKREGRERFAREKQA